MYLIYVYFILRQSSKIADPQRLCTGERARPDSGRSPDPVIPVPKTINVMLVFAFSPIST